jgi:hypothetical protein
LKRKWQEPDAMVSMAGLVLQLMMAEKWMDRDPSVLAEFMGRFGNSNERQKRVRMKVEEVDGGDTVV